MTAPRDAWRTAADLTTLGTVIREFRLESLNTPLQACEELSRADALMDVAVLGQFKSGKSSLLNAILSTDIFPVGALPATAVVTRATAGATLTIQVRRRSGAVEIIEPHRLAEFATETGNPHNERQVAIVDVFTPALRDWPGIRLVDTPGLGSAHPLNTAATREWLPNVAVALVVVSVERPLGEEDLRLLSEARQLAGRTFVVLTKVDLLSAEENRDVLAFIQRALGENRLGETPILQCSTRCNRDSWIAELKRAVLDRLKTNLLSERRQALAQKMSYLIRASRAYLEVGLRAAEQSDTARARLRDAVLNESVKAELIRDELRLALIRANDMARPALERQILPNREPFARSLIAALRAESQTWTGGIAQQVQTFETWLSKQLLLLLTPVAQDSERIGEQLCAQAEERFRRIADAFRDRLGRNVQESMGIEIPPVTWDIQRPQLPAVPVMVGRTFMTPWEILGWIVPMRLVGGIFRRHIERLVPWEVEKNLSRLVADCTISVQNAMAHLHDQALRWVESERRTIEQMLNQHRSGAQDFRGALARLERIEVGSKQGPTLANEPESPGGTDP